MITVRNVTKRYGGATVLDDVSCEIPRGGITSIIGLRCPASTTFRAPSHVPASPCSGSRAGRARTESC